VNIDNWLDFIPLWGVFALTVVLVLLAIGVGFFTGRSRREQDPEVSVGSVVGATLGLLAFLLAFTFGASASRYDMRKQLLLDEVNSIETTYLRADLLPEARSNEVRKLLREYVDLREQLAREPERLSQIIMRSDVLHKELWDEAIASAKEGSNAAFVGRFIDSLNSMIDLQTKRLTVGLQYRIPGAIWLALCFVAALSMAAMGYQFGLSNTSNYHIHILVALTFSIVIFLIVDLDRAREGMLQVNQQPMTELQQRLETPPPESTPIKSVLGP